jgi:ATP-dependent Clp protease protease subunit
VSTPSPGPGVPPTRVWLERAEQRGGLYERLLERRIVMAHGHLDDEAATSLSAQLLTLDAEGDDPIRFELQNLTAGLAAALTVMGVLDTVGVPVHARAGGQITGPALGVLAACTDRRAYPNAMFEMSEPVVEFDGRVTALAAREEQVSQMLDSLYARLADVTGREVDEIRDDARRNRVLTAGEAIRYGLISGPATAGR